MDTSDSLPSAAASIHTTPSTSRPSSSRSSTPPTEASKDLAAGLPTSALFEVRQTPSAGRAVFALQDIPADTLLWRANDLSLCVLLREYRREVCAQCFSYDSGRDLAIRDRTLGFVFCSAACQATWTAELGATGIAAWTAVEALVKQRSKEDSAMVDADLPRPPPDAIQRAWAAVAVPAALIRTARLDPAAATKQHRRALQKALIAPLTPDVLAFCVAGILWQHAHPSQLPSLLALAADATPYHSADDLAAFTRTYLQLLAALPLPLLPLVTPHTLLCLSSRDSHNSFGIRSLADDGSEFFGYGCWPAASYFNHSCAPNVLKKRVARTWEFRLGEAVRTGAELCITYLSGEERMLSRVKRMERLRRNWGFDCGCVRCGGGED
jgi:hypothetical protein